MPDGAGPPAPRPGTPRYGEGRPTPRAGGRRTADDAFEDLLDAFTNHLDEVRCLSFETQDSYAKAARAYYRWLMATEPALGLEQASSATIRAFVTFEREQRIGAGTIATYLQALKGFYQFLLLDDPNRPNPVRGVRGPRVMPPPIDPFTEDEIRQMLSFAQRYEHSSDLRRWVGYVALVIFASTGVRNAELRNLETAKVNLSRRELRVVGKGSKERIIPFGPGAAEVLRVYAAELRPRLPSSPYFLVNPASIQGPNRGRIGEMALVDLVRLLLAEAGISGRANPHRFRHSYATLTTSQTGNVELTRELLGHSDITTTSRYVHTAMKDRHLAADGVDLVPVGNPTGPVAARVPALPSPFPPPGLLGPMPRALPVPHAGPEPWPAEPAATRASSPQPARPEEEPHGEDPQGRAESILTGAVEAARQLPPRLAVHLNPERLLEVALGSLITNGQTTAVYLAAAGAVLSWAHDLPLPLGPLLTTYGPGATQALLQVSQTLELLGALDPTPGGLGSLP
ncbi:MAG: tyrosine-type recombinase/integrase [Candidatus Dormibacteria bacterium]